MLRLKYIWIVIGISSGIFTIRGQENQVISTADITHFWEAYDQLAAAKSHEDSLLIMQEQYIDRATEGFKEFLRVRDFTAEEYVKKIGRYPSFWASVRASTERIATRTDEVEEVVEKLRTALPDFKNANICFAIGGLRTGGTISDGWVLIGSEISASDSTAEKSELSPWLQSVIGNTGDIVSMVAHEFIHTQQHSRGKSNLLTMSMGEGIADFMTQIILGTNINAPIHPYGIDNECELWQLFQQDLENAPKNYTRWLYNGPTIKDRPADLGYFMGFRIAEAYYNKQKDKEKALQTLLNYKKYKKVLKDSGYDGGCSR